MALLYKKVSLLKSCLYGKTHRHFHFILKKRHGFSLLKPCLFIKIAKLRFYSNFMLYLFFAGIFLRKSAKRFNASFKVSSFFAKCKRMR